MRNSIREMRAERGLSQADVAMALGVSRQTVIAIENDRYSPSLPLAFRIARFFGSRVEEIFEDSQEEVRS
ncbi:MAG: helix-turn-helix transcriptional regulator [Acidimicrobiales bacterium]